MEPLKLFDGVEKLTPEELRTYIMKRATRVVKWTQSDSWDDPEDYEIDLVELAHATFKLFRDNPSLRS